MRVAAIVLAAGEASRFGSPKQRILLPRVLERLRETSVDEIVVVEGAHELAADETRIVSCPEWGRGPGASLRCGLAALGDRRRSGRGRPRRRTQSLAAGRRARARRLARARRSRRGVVRRRARSPARARTRRLGRDSGRGPARPHRPPRPVRRPRRARRRRRARRTSRDEMSRSYAVASSPRSSESLSISPGGMRSTELVRT